MNENNNNQNGGDKKNNRQPFYTLGILVLVALFFTSMMYKGARTSPNQEITYTEFLTLVEEDKVAEVNAESGLHFQFLNDSGTAYTNLFLKITGLNSAPASIACVGKDSADLEEKVGYYGEKIVLFLQTIGLNTCWVGSFNKKRKRRL